MRHDGSIYALLFLKWKEKQLMVEVECVSFAYCQWTFAARNCGDFDLAMLT